MPENGSSPRVRSESKAESVPNGPAAAAILAAGIGCATLGLLVPLAEGILWVKNTLTWNGPVGPLSGKTIVACMVWAIAWAALHFSWRRKQVGFGAVWTVSLLLILVGILGTFPPIFQLFGH